MIVRARFRDTAVSLLTLLLSGGTLLCCALPLLLITLGLGGAVAYLTDSLPWLVTLSRYKVWMFVVSGIYLVFTGWMIYRPGRVCPTDLELARLCERADRFNRSIFWIAATIFLAGVFAAYLLVPLRQLFAS